MKIKNIIFLAFQNIQINYLNSFFSFLWIPFSFFILILIKSYLFIDVLNIRPDKYLPHLITGLLFWISFSQIVIRNLNIFYKNQLILNVNIPPHKYLLISFFELMIGLFLNLIFLFLYLIIHEYTINPLLLVLSYLYLIVLFYELAKFISIVFLLLRDLVFFINSSLILIFFLTPIIWEPSMLSDQNFLYLQYNPFYHILEIFRCFIYRIPPPQNHLIIVFGIYLSLLFINKFFSNKIIHKINLFS